MTNNSEIQDAQEQLNEVRELLAADPNNSEYLVLEENLKELINILSADACDDASPSVNHSSSDAALKESTEEDDAIAEAELEAATSQWQPVVNNDDNKEAADGAQQGGKAKEGNDSSGGASKVKKKKSKKKDKIKEFEVPDNLVILESDSVAEKNRKKRAVKALKSKFREKRKEYESNAKQNSWQNFQKKKRPGIRQGDSIWSTSEDIHGKVGVVGKRDKSDYSERKRYKSG